VEKPKVFQETSNDRVGIINPELRALLVLVCIVVCVTAVCALGDERWGWQPIASAVVAFIVVSALAVLLGIVLSQRDGQAGKKTGPLR